jgi:hypothetical protein
MRRVPSAARGDHGGQPLGDGGHRERDGDLEVVDGAARDGAVLRVCEVVDVEQPQQDADGGDHLGEQRAELVELHLERRGLRLGVRHLRTDLADLRRAARARHDGEGRAVAHRRAREAHVDARLDLGALLDDDVGLLHDRLALAGQDRLVQPQRRRLELQQPQVGGHTAADAQADHVSRHELHRADRPERLAVAPHVGVVGLVLLERIDRLLGVGLLPDADPCVEHQDDDDDQRLDHGVHPLRAVLLGEGQQEGDGRGAQ